ncbi:uncharacterized protein LOC111308032 [Durio zibethinus]|uniref:Uncharacterized protein LOC111308032 n=1 Tax=Durio zibethinus TaxID=66656 RepID=A0A6P6ABA7_DURZI|nr:uncharacterized protein LOC111308032 [Durio zibethinus]
MGDWVLWPSINVSLFPTQSFTTSQFTSQKSRSWRERERAMLCKRKRSAEKGNGGRYEKLREQKIKENKQRMQNLGVEDIGSSQICNKNPKRKPFDNDEIEIHLEEGWKPEIYTHEHEILFGDCETSLNLLVDGFGSDGKRIFDPLGLHTHCSQCKLVQGQLSGDCLYTRYGENVIEVNQNPNWICPVCRRICSCSLCCQQKGWRPPGSIYRKVNRLGFKSVAHYLIQTYCGQVNMESLVSAELLTDAGSPHSLLNEAIDIDEHTDGSPRPLGEECEDGKQEEVKELHCLDSNNDNDGADTDGKLK